MSQVTGEEEHRISIIRPDGGGPSIGASDTALLALGGRAPDDWISVDTATNTVSGSGFELRPTGPSGDDVSVAPGELISDCP